MKFKAPPLDIPDNNPFVNDALDRARIIRELATFVNTIQEPFVIALDGNWGTGKTTFVKMWQNHIHPHAHSLYFNAWESDFSVDPLIALIGETSALIHKMTNQKRTAAKRHLRTIGKYAARIARVTLPVLVNIGTRGVLNLSAETESAIASLAKSQVEKTVNTYERSKKTIQSLKSELSKFAAEGVRRRGSGVNI